ncbi:hypothetical protein [Thermococcus henrietii]|uniref:hypothetical protein n=1 Tax=Thermococcus henrietii TaxID=2016361 RepID=UPI000C07B99F|nr:hypothetical protein [Thermococcus henrietii]
MRVLIQSPTGADIIALVLTGDGRTEEKVLPAIAKRYNGRDKILLFPKRPLSKKTGLNVIKSVPEVYELTGHTRYVILIDKEHFDLKKLDEICKDLFKDYVVTGSNPYVVRTNTLEVHIVVQGEKFAIEEWVGKLINLELGREEVKLEYSDVKSLKSQIMTVIRTYGYKTLTKFILSCKLENLETAFKPLVDTLKYLEEIEE